MKVTTQLQDQVDQAISDIELKTDAEVICILLRFQDSLFEETVVHPVSPENGFRTLLMLMLRLILS